MKHQKEWKNAKFVSKRAKEIFKAKINLKMRWKMEKFAEDTGKCKKKKLFVVEIPILS